MNKKPIFPILIIIVLISGTTLGFGQISGQNSLNLDNTTLIENLELEELKIKEVNPSTYAFKSLDGNLIEIGTEKHSPPQPYLKLEKWEGEVSLKVGIPYPVFGKPEMVGGKLRYTVNKEAQSSKLKNQNYISKIKSRILSWLIPFSEAESNNRTIDFDFYPKEPEEIRELDSQGNEQRFIQNEQGGVEFDTILYEKPETNTIVFPIETKGLKFYYQPALNQENQEQGLTCSETTCWDENGNITTFRPENVVGSYAVYHETQDKLFKTEEEAEKYKTGKAFHIYRPKITDANGNWTWGELNIDEQAGVLTITIDQNWLDKAVYPVTIDPTFGYTTDGGSEGPITYSPNIIFDDATGSAGTGISMSAYIRAGYGSSNNVQMYLYDANLNKVTNGITNENTNIGSTLHWETQSFTSAPTLTAQTYYMAVWSDGTGPIYGAYTYVRYDTATGNNGWADSGNSYNTWPATLAKDTTYSDRIFSIYVTYTAAPPSIPIGNQEWSTSTGVSYGSGTDATSSTSTAVELDLSKPTSHPSTSTDDIYWGLGVPSGTAAGTYSGTTTFEAKAD